MLWNFLMLVIFPKKNKKHRIIFHNHFAIYKNLPKQGGFLFYPLSSSLELYKNAPLGVFFILNWCYGKRKQSDSMKQNGNMTQAMELYVQGMAQKDIAGMLGVSEQTVSVWKGSCRGTASDWDNRKRQANERKQAFPSWIEEKIDHTMKEIDNALKEGIPEEDLLKRLDAFITMKKEVRRGHR